MPKNGKVKFSLTLKPLYDDKQSRQMFSQKWFAWKELFYESQTFCKAYVR